MRAPLTTMAGSPPAVATSGALDPDVLFESRTVDEIKSFSRSLTLDIEKKREELRTLCGEKYRDLMDAANTVALMNDSAGSAIQSIKDVLLASRELQSHIGVAVVTTNGEQDVRGGERETYLMLAAEIKLLMTTPESIWSAVERTEYLLAAQLFLFSRHIYTGLSLEASRSEGGLHQKALALSHFPMIDRQWASIAHFHEAILSGCQKVLQSPHPPTAQAVNALASTVLLKGLTTEELFHEFLALRFKALEGQLQRDRNQETAKALIANSLKVIMSTVSILNASFCHRDEEHSLESTIKQAAVPSLSLLQTKMSPVLRFLPKNIQDFRPLPLKPIVALNQDLITREITSWLDRIHGLIEKEASDVLLHINAIASLTAVRKGIHDFLAKQEELKLEEWRAISLSVVGRELNLWDEFFRSLFRDRAESLISSQSAGIAYMVESRLLSLFEEKDFNSTEVDVSRTLWSESGASADDVVLPHLAASGIRPIRPTTKMSHFELKATGFSTRVQSLCRQLEELLAKLAADMTLFVRQKDAEAASPYAFMNARDAKEPFDLDEGSDAILQFEQQTLTKDFRDMLGKIVDKRHFGDEASVKARALFLGRFLQAIPSLCPHLEQCVLIPALLSPDSALASELWQQRRTAAAKPDPVWSDLRAKLEEESCRLFQIWTEATVRQFKSLLASRLVDDPAKLISLFVAWDAIAISEETEDGSKIQSQISVPQHPSSVLLHCLSRYCEVACKAAPFSLPSPVQLAISQDAAHAVLEVYHEVAARTKLQQMVALQLHFDATFLGLCMIARDSKALAQKQADVVAALEAHIDPFDLSVFLPYMSAHAKKSVLRHQSALSLLIPNDRFSVLSSFKSVPTASAPQQESHNITWVLDHKWEKVPLLPVPRREWKKEAAATSLTGARSSTSLQVMSLSARGSSQSPVGPRKKRERSPVAKAAGSFFGAVSNSWFGGK